MKLPKGYTRWIKLVAAFTDCWQLRWLSDHCRAEPAAIRTSRLLKWSIPNPVTGLLQFQER
jgi:hypothetical protein